MKNQSSILSLLCKYFSIKVDNLIIYFRSPSIFTKIDSFNQTLIIYFFIPCLFATASVTYVNYTLNYHFIKSCAQSFECAKFLATFLEKDLNK
jgi:hypothetical protein